MNSLNLSWPTLTTLLTTCWLGGCFADPAPSGSDADETGDGDGDATGDGDGDMTGDGDGDGDMTGDGDGDMTGDGDGDMTGDGDGDPPCTGEGCDCAGNEDICDAGLYCSPAGECTAPVCGDGVLQPLEQCDDSNEVDGDGCDADCTRTEVLFVNAAGQNTCVLLEGGNVRCWGRNDVGQLGYGHTNDIGDDETPAAVGNVMLPEPGVELTMNDFHSCILMADMAVRCWGNGNGGQLGYGDSENIGDDEFPISITDVAIGSAALEIDAGGTHTCARLGNGKVRCWGSGNVGQLGYGNTNSIGDDEAPSTAGDVPVGAAVTSVATGYQHTCAITASDTIRCWGRGSGGRLGYASFFGIGDDEPASAAGDVSAIPMGLPPTTKPTALALGLAITCALYDTGDVLCWGAGITGALGQGIPNLVVGDDEFPSTLPPISLPGPAIAITAGDHHACALLDDAQAVCWGPNATGQLGYGHTDDIGDDETPDMAGTVQLGGPIKQIDAGGSHTCAIMAETNAVVCWGSNAYGQLGYGHTDSIGDDELPVDAGPIALF
jgi:cysteine-rich repeat protein